MLMGRGLILLISGMIFLFFLSSNGEEIHPSVKIVRTIRRAFLDIKGVPPTIKEIEWYTGYNKDSYEAALDDLLNVKLKSDLIFYVKKYYLSPSYTDVPPVKISKEQLDKIILYQSGYKEGSLLKAKLKIVTDALAVEEGGADAIDYIAEALMGRVSHIEEANALLKIRKKYSKEEDGLLAVLEEILTFKDFLYK